MRKLITTTLIIMLVGLVALPAMAAPSADTTLTFSVAGGTLDITAPASRSFGTGLSPGQVVNDVALGNVNVSDTRNISPAAWTATAQSTSFTAGASTIPNTALAMRIDTGVFPPVYTGTGCLRTIHNAVYEAFNAAPLTYLTVSGCEGNNTAQFNPYLRLTVPGSAFAGSYSGVLTSAVS